MRAKKTGSPNGGKPQPDPTKKGLPANLEVEKILLALILIDGSRFGEVPLELDDFSYHWHRRIFQRMQDIHGRGEHIDLHSLCEELQRRSEFDSDTLSSLAALQEGVPLFPSMDSHFRQARRKNIQRRAVLLAQKLLDESLLGTELPESAIENHLAEVLRLQAACNPSQKSIRQIEDLESIFANRTPLEYIIKPEVPVKAMVCLFGDSESGKTTLACAWARDAHEQGHAVILLDRDKNPRDRICERLERLGVVVDGELFRIWDCEQEEDPPQPNDPRLVDWIKRMFASTGKSPMVIVDALISFLLPGEDENDATAMRGAFDRCRLLTKYGATVILLHHTNRQGEPRGSSDFRPAGDQTFTVKNRDRGGGRYLDVITLEVYKSRYGLSEKIVYHYDDGRMTRQASQWSDDNPPMQSTSERLELLLRANAGVTADKFEELASLNNIARQAARAFLKRGAAGGIRVEIRGRAHHHYWRGDGSTDHDASPELDLD